MEINNLFNINEIVFLRTDPDQFERLVTAFQVEHNKIEYRISMGANFSWHSDYELSTEKSTVINTVSSRDNEEK